MSRRTQLWVLAAFACGAIPALLVAPATDKPVRALIGAATISICVSPVLRRIAWRRFDIFEPIVPATAMLLMLFGVHPLWSTANGEHVWTSGPVVVEFGQWLGRAMFAGFLGSLLFVVGYELVNSRPLIVEDRKPKVLPGALVALLAAGMTILGAVLWLYGLTFAGSFREGLHLVLHGQSVRTQDALSSSEYLTSAPVLGGCAAILLLLSGTRRPGWRRVLGAAACAAVPAVIFTIEGGRRFMIPSVGIPLVAYALTTGWRPSRWLVSIGIPLAFVVLILMPAIRTAGARENSGGLVPAVRHNLIHPREPVKLFFTSSDTEQVTVLAIEMKVLRDWSDYSHGGATFGDLLIAPVPSKLIPGKPTTARDQLLMKIVGSKCDVRGRGCPDYSVVGTFYQDFGFPSVIVFMSLLGAGTALLWRRWLRRPRSRTATLLAASWTVMLPVVLRAGWMPAFAWWLYFVVPTAVALWLASSNRLASLLNLWSARGREAGPGARPRRRPPNMSRVVWLLDRVPRRLAGTFHRDRRAARALRPLVNALVPRGPTVVVIRSGAAAGLRIQIDPRREKFYWSGTHEAHVQKAIAELLEPGSTFWDVGAHIGFHTLAAARAVGPGGRVVAFEPVSENRTRLQLNAELNRFENVEVVAVALGSSPGEARLFSRGSSLTWTLERNAPATTGDAIGVRTTTMDEAAKRFPPPDLVKVDAEGAELGVLAGGTDLLNRDRPAVLVELTDVAALGQVRDLMPGYVAKPLGDNHYLLVAESDRDGRTLPGRCVEPREQT